MSNLGETDQGRSFTEPANWNATSFTTGSETATLNGLIARLTGFGGGDEFISIYSNFVTNSVSQPSSPVVTFLDNPADLGSNRQFRFTPSSNFELAADTTYWVVFGHNGNGGDYEPYWTLSPNQSGRAGWSIGDTHSISSNRGVTWTATGQPDTFQFAVTIVPEPREYAFVAGLMIGIFIFARRKFVCVKLKI